MGVASVLELVFKKLEPTRWPMGIIILSSYAQHVGSKVPIQSRHNMTRLKFLGMRMYVGSYPCPTSVHAGPEIK